MCNQEIVKRIDEILLEHIHSFKYQFIFFTFTAQQAHDLKGTAGHVQTMLMLYTLMHVLHKTYTIKQHSDNTKRANVRCILKGFLRETKVKTVLVSRGGDREEGDLYG